ncbi:hypothetical protein CD114_11110 [Mammaliicoccus sciuri]|nr:hypothetical protein CD114_11110 [Mammaliicoccus sciuri]PTJ65055.1 hypothetical protein BUZ97_02675 [Mammaliicoccus sciuri]PTK08339.1 hypothetical protein BUZ89_01810 [Mammaliicoccus sciuri]PTK24062.1 hypothetical protein BUZ86_12175 [Mammaliicoccus sciuri]RIN90480.1 hypothetical protein BU011_01645 [Mammaliicoccus sciuri]
MRQRGLSHPFHICWKVSIGLEIGNMDRYGKLPVQKTEIWTDKKIYRSRNGKYRSINKISDPKTGFAGR